MSLPLTTPLIVFSRQRWEPAYQRSQHLLSRIAHQHRVIYVEEPVCEPVSQPKFEFRNPCDNVLVARPVTPIAAPGFCDAQMPMLQELLLQLLDDEGIDAPVAWCTTPDAFPLLDPLQPQAVIFDAADAPPTSAAQLRRADVVLAASLTQQAALRALHRNVQAVPNGVEAAQYAPSRVTTPLDDYLAAEQLQGHILAPRLGFAGPIDDSVDLALLDSVAAARADWHFVMVGAVSVDTAVLPRRANLHWLGQQAPSRLPALVAGWDVCVLPLAPGEAARHLDPAITLACLAAEKPVVSTPAEDVVGLYGDVVAVAADTRAFIDACERALQETPDERAGRLARSAAVVARHGWDAAARSVLRLMDDAVDEAMAAGRRGLAPTGWGLHGRHAGALA